MVIKKILFVIILFAVVSPVIYSLSITPISPKGNSVISESSVLLSIFTDKYGSCSYSLDFDAFQIFPESEDVAVTTPGSVVAEGDAWRIASSTKRLELSEDLAVGGIHRELLSNITSFIQKGDLKALDSGQVSNNKATSPYNQYLYLLGGPAERNMDSGYVLYTEDDDTDTLGDYLYFKSGREIARYLLEFTTPFQSGIYDNSGSSSKTGVFLTDYQDEDITMMGKKYTIVTARRTNTIGNNIVLTLLGGAGKDTLLEKQTKTYTVSGKDYEVTLNFVDTDEAQFVINTQSTKKLKVGDSDKLSDGIIIGITDILYQDYAGGIHSATFFIGANKLELKDTDVTDVASSNALKVDDNTIDDALVTIEGNDDNSTFKINRIHINMSADDNYFVPAGGKLSEAIKSGGTTAEPEVLFTSNWDIEYRGLAKESIESIKVKTNGLDQYRLEFLDADGNKVSLPIAKAVSNSSLLFGEQSGRALINKENTTISKDDYIIISDVTSYKRGERRTYVLQYKGADKVTSDNPALKFKNIGSGTMIEQVYSSASSLDVVTPGGMGGKLANLKLGGSDFAVYNSSSILSNDFSIVFDLNADGVIKSALTSNATEPVVITTKNGMEINVTNESTNAEDNTDIVFLTFRIPDESRDGSARDSTETLVATVMRFNVTASSGEIRMAQDTTTETRRLNLRTPSGKTNIAYAYDSYGSYWTWETPTSAPQLLTIEVPAKQRIPLVYITAKGASFIDKVPTTIHVNKNKWKVSTSTKKLDLSEDLVNGINREILNNITTFIDRGDLSGLDSESITNNKSNSTYNQYLYLLGPSSYANMDSGYVVYTKDDRNITADYLYFKSGREIGRYLLEFTTPFGSGVYNNSGSSSPTGLFLKDFNGIRLKLFGKNYTITNASRISVEGNGINLTLIGESDKLELADTSVKDTVSSNNLKVNDTYIDDAFVIIEGSNDNSTFNISRIHINMTINDNFYVPSGSRLSETIKDINSKPQVLFTQNWDISYLGLSNVTMQKIKLNTSGLNQYNLEFVDGDGNIVNVPIATSPNDSKILMGNTIQPFINRENLTITKNAYFVLTDGSKKRGERKSFILQYLGADKLTAENPVLKFRNLGTNTNILQSFSNASPLATINVGSANYKVFAADDPIRANLTFNDFDIRIDLDRSGTLNNDISSNVMITTSFGAEINITNQTEDRSILLSIRTPDDGKDSEAKDSVDTIYPSVLIFNITASSGIINHTKLGNLNFRVSSGQTNVEYAYTSYGTYIKRESPAGLPAIFEIDYPSAQREALVYYENGVFQSKLLTNISERWHNLSIRCTDIFGNVFNNNLSFNYTKIPLILNVSPTNNSYNVSVNSNIILNFRRKIDTSNLKSNIFVKDSDNNKVSGTIVYNDIINQTIFDPTHFLKFNTNYIVNITKNIQDLSGNSLESDHFWNFTTTPQDTDNDGLPDNEDTDIDNDGIDDNVDFFRGNLSNINSNFPHLKMMIDSDENLSKIFNGTKKVEVYRGGIKLIEFDFVFSNNTKLDLSNISILNASNDSIGGVIVKGIGLSNLGLKKNTTVERINNSMNGICIKDEEIDWVDNISSSCNAANEYKIECDGTTQNGYTCIYNQTTNLYQVSGLSHSGVIQLSYTKPSDDSGGSSGGSSSGGGSGGGGGGGGGSAGNVCNMEWQCDEWTECTNRLQTRQCNFVKVSQHWQETQCPDESKPPLKSQTCETKTVTVAIIPPESKGIKKETSKSEEIDKNKEQITGMAIQETQKTDKLTAFVIVAMTAVLCVLSYYKFFRLKK